MRGDPGVKFQSAAFSNDLSGFCQSKMITICDNGNVNGNTA